MKKGDPGWFRTNTVTRIITPSIRSSLLTEQPKKVYYTGLFYYLSHFSKFIRPGARRIATSGGGDQINFVSFRNVDNSIVLNILNSGVARDCLIAWKGKSVVQHLPAHSITTLKWKTSGLPGE